MFSIEFKETFKSPWEHQTHWGRSAATFARKDVEMEEDEACVLSSHM
jgi:hypothetical protein